MVIETEGSLLGAQKENMLTFIHSGQKLETETKTDSTIGNQIEKSDLREVLNLEQVINLEENKKAKNSEAYTRWIKIHNLKIQAKTFSFMSEHGLLEGTELDEEYDLLTKTKSNPAEPEE